MRVEGLDVNLGSTIFTDEHGDHDCASMHPAGHASTSKNENMDSEDAHMLSVHSEVDLDDLKRVVQVYSDNPELTVSSLDVPAIDDVKASGGTSVPIASNPVFLLANGQHVLKCIKLRNKDSAFFRARILEVDTLMSKSPYLMSAIGVFLQGDHLCIVMNRMTVMDNFARAMRAQGKELPHGVLASMLSDWLGGLDALDQRGLVHCDIKPPNLFLNELSSGVIGDFDSTGMQCKVKIYKLLYGLPPHLRCTLGYSLPDDIKDSDMVIGIWFDILSLVISALELLLGGENPVFALVDGSLEEKQLAFSTTLLEHPNLLKSLQEKRKLKIKDVRLRIVLQEMADLNPRLRISPKKAIEILAPSVVDPEQKRAFVHGVLQRA